METIPIDNIKKIARGAGKILRKYYEINRLQSLSLIKKNSNYDMVSLQTHANKDSSNFIVEQLKKAFPNHNISDEEFGVVDNKSNYVWYVDSLIGTNNFYRQIPIYGISIGLTYNHKPVLGVLYFPELDELYFAKKGDGAFVQTATDERKLSVSSRTLNQSLYYAAGKYKGKTWETRSIVDAVSMIKTIDASSYELANIASGGAEIYELVSVNHDVAAGAIIIREAGGRVTDYQGNEWTDQSTTILATNGVVHEEVLELMKKN